MDEATTQALNEFVQRMIGAANTGMTWTAEQAPLLVQEWLRWYFWEHALYAAVLLLVPFMLVTLLWRVSATWSDEDDRAGARLFIGGIMLCVMVLGGGHNLLQAVKVTVAPRVVVIEKFTELATGRQGR